jgi:hypothetical protein
MNDHPCPQCHARGKAKLHLQAPRFLRCDQCGVMYRAPFPDAASLARWYSEKRWREAAKPSHIVLFTPAALQKSLLALGVTDGVGAHSRSWLAWTKVIIRCYFRDHHGRK